MDDEWEEGDDIQPLNVAKVAKKRLREAKVSPDYLQVYQAGRDL